MSRSTIFGRVYTRESISYHAPVFAYSFPQVITKDICNQYRKSFPQSNTSNVHAWHSDWNTHTTTDVFDPLIKLTIDTCNHISEDVFESPITYPYHYVIDNLWLTMYERSDYTQKHNHFPSEFSACYYVDVNDNSSPILFGYDHELSIQPENGMLLIWLSIIPHEVESTESQRTCICMNIGKEKIV